jgi:deazaflavin-dependent oxidoreductase (nitroreductase family)
MESKYFLKPKPFERFMNKTIGVAARLGFVPRYVYLLQVRGRRTGKMYSTPVNLLEFNGRRYLVGGRGHAAWSKNAAAAGEVTLIRGKDVQRLRAVELPDDQKPEILRAYLNEYRQTVQRFFSVPASSPLQAFRAIADRHPVFELVVVTE